MKERYKEKMDEPASDIVLINKVSTPGLGEVDNAVNLILVKHLAQLPLIRFWEHDSLSCDVWNSVEEFFNDRR